MRISDWSSDVCSSDLDVRRPADPDGDSVPPSEDEVVSTVDPMRAAVADAAAPARPRRRIPPAGGWGPVVVHAILITTCAVIVIPLLWMVMTAMKAHQAVFHQRSDERRGGQEGVRYGRV